VKKAQRNAKKRKLKRKALNRAVWVLQDEFLVVGGRERKPKTFLGDPESGDHHLRRKQNGGKWE